MAAAGKWNTVIDRGAVWRRTLRFRDAVSEPIPIEGPAFMDIRTRMDPNSALIARLDDTGSADGVVSFGPDINQVNLFLSAEATADIGVGEYFFDVFVSDQSGDLIRLVQGEVSVRAQVSSP